MSKNKRATSRTSMQRARQANQNKTRRRGVWLLAAAVVVAAVVFLVVRGVGSKGSDKGVVRAGPASGDISADSRPAMPLPKLDVLRDSKGSIVGRRMRNPRGNVPFKPKSTPAQTQKAIDDYKRNTRYPSTSQPLLAHNTDLMQPNQRYEREKPSRHDKSVRILYSGAKNTVVGDEPITTFLRVTKDGQPLPVKILEAKASVRGSDGKPVSLSYSSAGGGSYANQFSPTQFGNTKAAYVETSIWFELGPAQEEHRTLRFFYTPKSGIPARFTGQFRDVLENGSLVVYAGIEVTQAGHYVIDCNLYSLGDKPVMFARHKGPIKAGRGEVRLLFFGKALRDQGVPPPYKIGELRGGLHVLSLDPDMQSMPLEEWKYTTQTKFSLEELSDADYDSAHKRKMIDLMQRHGTKPGSDDR